MKRRTKLLTAVLTLTMGIVSMGALAGCDNDGSTKAEELVSQAQTAIDGKQAELEQKIADLTEAYQAKDNELLSSITAKEENIASLTAAYEAKIAELEQADGNNQQAIENLTAEYETKVAEIQQDIAELNEKITANKTELQQKIDALKSEYETAIDDLETLIAEIQNTDKAQTEKITELEERLDGVSNIHTHEWGEAIVLQEPTCEEDGFFVQYCGCGEDKLTVQNADGEHVWSETIVLSEATCIVAGGAIRFCKVCQTTEHILLEKPHRYDEYGLCIDCQPLSSRGLAFTLSEDGSNYSLTGIGSCNNDEISIPATVYGIPVTSIGNSAFRGCNSLTEIVIPDSVTSIGEWAVYGCSGLTSITVGENNTAYKSIDGNLYSKDGKTLIQYAIGKTITMFMIPNGVTSIGEWAFSGCANLTSLVIGDNVTSIGRYAFSGCTSLTEIVIPDGVTSISNLAFDSCSSLTNIIVGENNTAYKSIDGNLYSKDGKTLIQYAIGKTATKFTIPNSVTSIDAGAFDGCHNLTSVNLGNGLTSISNSAFAGCSSLKEIFIPDNVVSIGEWVFYDCDSLAEIVIHDGVTSIGNYAFCDCTNLTSITLGNGVTSIGDQAFSNCTSLTEIVIPDSVTEIGSSVFSYCSSLTNITVVENNTAYKSIGGNLYSKDGKTLIQYAIGKTTTMFMIPNGVTSIGEWAFSGCTNLTSLVIGDNVTSIGNSAFWNCSRLTEIVIPDSVTSIGRGVFELCSRLTNIVFEDPFAWYVTNDYWNWNNKRGGTGIDVTNAIDNVVYFTDTYVYDYWYKE